MAYASKKPPMNKKMISFMYKGATFSMGITPNKGKTIMAASGPDINLILLMGGNYTFNEADPMSLKYKLQQYIGYKLKAKNEYSLHSPFMFELYNEVFKKAKKADDTYNKIEQRRRELLKDDTSIYFIDLGAGSVKGG